MRSESELIGRESTLKRWAENAWLILQCIPAGLAMAINKPGVPRLRVKEIKQTGECHRTIELEYLDARYGHWQPCRIVLDTEKRVLFPDGGSNWGGIGNRHTGSGGIGVVLFSAPVLILASPVLWAINRIYRFREERNNMSRYALALLATLKGQLDDSTKILLHHALQNEWQEDKRYRLPVTLDEARAILARAHLYEERNISYPSLHLVTDYEWYDENDFWVGATSRYDSHGDEDDAHIRPFWIQVYGTRFQGDDAKALLQCRKAHTLHDRTTTLSFDEARTLLAGADLKEHTIVQGTKTTRHLKWINPALMRDDYFAQGKFSEKRRTVVVKGSLFKDTQADALATCFKTRDDGGTHHFPPLPKLPPESPEDNINDD